MIVASVAIVPSSPFESPHTSLNVRRADLTATFAPMLVPLGLAWSVVHYLRASLADAQSFVALLSDPLGRGWDVFGTVQNTCDYRRLTPTQAGWIETIVCCSRDAF